MGFAFVQMLGLGFTLELEFRIVGARVDIGVTVPARVRVRVNIGVKFQARVVDRVNTGVGYFTSCFTFF